MMHSAPHSITLSALTSTLGGRNRQADLLSGLEIDEKRILGMRKGKGASHSFYRGIANLIHFTAGRLERILEPEKMGISPILKIQADCGISSRSRSLALTLRQARRYRCRKKKDKG